MPDAPSIAVFGAGAIGCWVGGMLAAAGTRVTLIGRARVLDELAGGLTVSELDGATHTIPLGATLSATTDPAAAADATWVLVTVKSGHTRDAGETLARVLPPSTPVLSLQNGVRNASVLRDALPGRSITSGMVPFNVVRRAAGSYHRGSSGTLLVARGPDAAAFAARCTDARLAIAQRDDMPAVQWAKLVLNLNNAINALSGQPLAAQLADRAYRRCLAASQREALALLRAAGEPVAKLTVVPPRWMPRMLELPDAVFRALSRQAIAIDPHARSSMADDLAAGRPTEIDFLQGEVVALAARLQRPAPVNARILELVRAAEAGGSRAWSGAELWSAIASARG